jgi:hypothetical protein
MFQLGEHEVESEGQNLGAPADHIGARMRTRDVVFCSASSHLEI